MNLTFNQKVAFMVAVFSFLAAGGSSADLAILFGPVVSKIIIAAASICAGIGGLFLSVVTGQANVIKDMVTLAKDPNSPIQGVITTATKEGQDLAKAIPGPIYFAGSDKATEIAKS